MIVATAGHVDHGKTTLVRALTGVDTDRLPEEKRRGMTIEPGYTHADLGLGEPVGFVDVPGHEGFLRQAIAGLAAADVALLVIACDDGPMPQTREHLALLQHLGVRPGAVVLSKADRVDAGRLRAVRENVDAWLRGTSFASAPVYAVSAEQGQGLDALRAGLRQLASTLQPRPPSGAFRLAVDRAFTRAGVGTVVTGTALSGRVQVGDSLHVVPGRQTVRVRGVEVHGEPAQAARAGQRCALALSGIDRESLARGAWLLDARLAMPTQRIDAVLQLETDAPRALDGHAELQLHLGAAALPVRVLLLQPRRLSPGQRGYVQLLLPSPVSALHGDRFVLRDAAAHALVGGGQVLDPDAPARGKTTDARIAELRAMDTDEPAQALAALLSLRSDGVDRDTFARQWNLHPAQLDDWRDGVPWQPVPTGAGIRLLGAARWRSLVDQVPAAVSTWHVDEPASRGMTEAALLAALQSGEHGVRDKALRQAALREALATGTVERDGFLLRRPGHEARLSAGDAALLHQVRSVMEPMGLRPPPLGELAPLLNLPLADAAAGLQRMASLGHIVQVARNRFFLPETVQALMQVARETAAAAPDGRFDAASFRDRSGVGRNLTIQLLEFFDRIGLTRFAAERRSIVG